MYPYRTIYGKNKYWCCYLINLTNINQEFIIKNAHIILRNKNSVIITMNIYRR